MQGYWQCFGCVLSTINSMLPRQTTHERLCTDARVWTDISGVLIQSEQCRPIEHHLNASWETHTDTSTALVQDIDPQMEPLSGVTTNTEAKKKKWFEEFLCRLYSSIFFALYSIVARHLENTLKSVTLKKKVVCNIFLSCLERRKEDDTKRRRR